MLALGRKVGESIVIDKGIEVQIISIDGTNVRLGIKAPKDIKIHRKEVYDKIEKANRDSLNGNHDIKAVLKNILLELNME